MTRPTISLDDLAHALSAGRAESGPSSGSDDEALLVVDLDVPAAAPVELHTGLPSVVVGLTSRDPAAHAARNGCDVVLHRDDPSAEAIERTVSANPLAAVALALVLRGSEQRSVDEGLLVESAVYSGLQAGPEFAAWRAARPRRERVDHGDVVALARTGGRLEVTLRRPDARNALNTLMRDQLTDAFRLVALDPSITDVQLMGAGPDFCAGGDLDEFGSFPDPATAHLIRLQQSAGRAIHAVAERVTAHLHGACIGSGIELPAFAGTIRAHPDTSIVLPEVSLGLIPGAGGTVSIPRRIGRHRTALLALSGQPVDASTALDWGLVDAIDER